jgi:tRNA(Ile)-lysidine synthase
MPFWRSMRSTFSFRIKRTISRRRLLQPEDRILVGVSGGADSVALARVLRELGYRIGVAHLNHGLRGGDSDADERFVAALADQLDVPFFARTAKIDRERGNIEEAGRIARRDFLENVRSDSAFDKIALGHSRDDRVETFMLNLFRGSGLEGLISMRASLGHVVRPLIDVRREEIETYLRDKAQSWRTDTSNFDLGFARNRMRHNAIPELSRQFNPRLTEAIARSIDVLEDEHEWMHNQTESWLQGHLQDDSSEIAVDAEGLALAPKALARRVIRESMRMAGISLTGVTFDQIETVREISEAGKSGKMAMIHGGAVAQREFERVVFRKREEEKAQFAYDLPVPGSVRASALGKVFRASVVDSKQAVPGQGTVFVDGERLGPYVRIRPWQPGDYYRPAGWPAGKLKKLFQRARIPRSQRSGWPVFVTDSGIVWVASFPVSREFAPSERSQKIVALEALSDSNEVLG